MAACTVLLALPSLHSLRAATLTFSSSPPPASNAISNFVGAGFDAANIGGSGVNANGGVNNGSANDGTTYVSHDRPAQGQTFTTGTNPGGYTLNAITVRMQGYTNNIATGSNIGSYSLANTGSTFALRVGKISGTTFIPYTIETSSSGGSVNPGTSGSQANGPGTYLTFTLKAPFVLQPNTVYAFDIGTSSDYFEMLGISTAAAGGANPYSGGAAYTSGGGGWGSGSITPQAGTRVFQINLTAYTPSAPGPFVHPGLLNTEADFERMRTKVALGGEPWASAYQALAGSWMGNSPNWGPNPKATITRSGALNDTIGLYNDIAVAYGCALRWKITGDTAYADEAVRILNAWGYTLTSISGDTNALLCCLYGYQFACVAEIMRSYSGWAPADIAQFQTMIYNVFYMLGSHFLSYHNGTDYSHYWANWDLCALDDIYAIGVFCDNTNLTTEATNYFYHGLGEGCIDRMVNFEFPGYFGQTQEMGRDQGHNTLDIAGLACLCQMAWNQGVDLYGYENNKILSASEYVAKYNLLQNVSFIPYWSSTGGLMWGPSSSGQPATDRPGWATFYNHYVNIKGLAAPYTQTIVNKNGSYWGYNGDEPGWDYLTATLDPIASGANPSGLTAAVTAGQPVLSWWGSAYATSYNVERSTTSGTNYSVIATGLTGDNTYTDTKVVPGTTYYYVVTGTLTNGTTGISNEAPAAVGARLTARLKFNEGSGGTASDATGNGWNGTLNNGAGWTNGIQGSSLKLSSGNSQFVSLPTGVMTNINDFTVTSWVYINTNNYWARIFDFGNGSPDNNQSLSGPENYLFLSAWPLRFGITRSGVSGEEGITASSTLPTGQWVHVAVTLSGSVATIYTNGIVTAQSGGVFVSPAHMPATLNNYIGRSGYNGDPYFNGQMDDFRIYQGALGMNDIQTLAAQGIVWLKFNEAVGTTAADSTANGWNGTLVNGASWMGGSVNLASASSQYVSLPTGVVNGLTNCTIASWVYLNSLDSQSRIFEFGSGTNSYMYLTPQDPSTGRMRFGITSSGTGGEQTITGNSPLITLGWHHVAVTLNGGTGTLYMDGVAVGANSAMTLTPSSLGVTTQNYLGRSQYAAPYLNAQLHDFHIYAAAFSTGQIATLSSGLSAPMVTVTPGDTQNVLNWNAVPNATAYMIERATSPGGPYTLLTGNFSGMTYADSGLTNATTYYYNVVAVSSFAASASSSQVSGDPLPPPPSAPTGLASIGSNAMVNLNWTASSTGTSYSVKRHDPSTSSFSVIARGLTNTTYADTTVTNGTTYTYVVSGSNLGGEGVNSALATGTPLNPFAQSVGSIVVSPSAVTLFRGQTQQFTAAAYDQYGQPMQNPLNFTWSLLSGVGSVNPLGLYSAGSSGTATVKVSVNGVSTNALVTIPAQIGIFSTAQDIGSPTKAGSSSYNNTNGVYTVQGGGIDVWGTSDQFQFAYQLLSGDGIITARVVTENNTGAWAKAGVMIRNTLDANSAYDYEFMTPITNNGVACQYRSTAGGIATGNNNATGVVAPYWVRLVRSGSTFTAYSSPDGVTWTQTGTALSIGMNSSVYVGLAVCSTSASSLCTAIFDNVTVSNTVTASTHTILPYDQNIGGSSGTYAESGSSTVSLTSQGGDIWGTNDSFHYAYTGIVGNGSITARVVSLSNSGSTAKAGVMIRNAVASGSMEYNNSLQYSYGANFQGRTNSAATNSTAFAAVGSLVPPYWLQLTRTNSTVVASIAPDTNGSPGTWTQLGSPQTLNSPQNTMFFGLDVASVNTGVQCTAVFDNIVVTGTTASAPTIATDAAAGGVSNNTDNLTVLGVSPWGATNLTYSWSLLGTPLATVSFSTNGVTAASNTTVTFNTGGTYYFQAVVTDPAGLTATSSIVGVSLVPFIPTNLSATGLNAQVALAWNGVLGATNYQVNRSLVSTGSYTIIGTTPVVSYTDTNVSNATTYYYTVQAVNQSGSSAASASASATPLSTYQQWLVGNGYSVTLVNTATPDGDGIPILMKYATAMKPGTPSSSTPTLLSETNNALTLQFNRLSPASVTYAVQASTNLSTWTNIATLTNGSDTWTGSAGISETGTNPRSVIITDPVTIGTTPTRFLRLQVTGGNP